MSHGVVHFEIPADDPDALAGFYGNLFGWQIDKMPGEIEYWMVRTVPTDEKGMPTQPGGINGGLMRRMAPEHRPVNYVNVESVADYVAKARDLGATVLMDKTPIPAMGWFAQLVDPQGNYFAMFQDDASAS
jgi:predicted enzyme related to lactoylglutathione lyase